MQSQMEEHKTGKPWGHAKRENTVKTPQLEYKIRHWWNWILSSINWMEKSHHKQKNNKLQDKSCRLEKAIDTRMVNDKLPTACPFWYQQQLGIKSLQKEVEALYGLFEPKILDSLIPTSGRQLVLGELKANLYETIKEEGWVVWSILCWELEWSTYLWWRYFILKETLSVKTPTRLSAKP